MRELLAFRKVRSGNTAAIIVALVLGIVVPGVIIPGSLKLLRPDLPYHDPGSIVVLPGASIQSYYGRYRVDPAFAGIPVFASVGLFGAGGLNVGSGAAIRVSAAAVDGEFFEILGVPPLVGRWLTAADEGGAAVAVVSATLWRRLGRGLDLPHDATVELNNRRFEVVGILPGDFTFPNESEVWIPPGSDSQITGSVFAPQVLARLRPGVTTGQAAAAVATTVRALGGVANGRRSRVQTLSESVTYLARPTLQIIVALASLLFVGSLGNVVSLQIADLHRRQNEVAVRIALGAQPIQLFRHFLAETLRPFIIGLSASYIIVAASEVGRSRFSIELGGWPVTGGTSLEVWLVLLALAGTVACALGPASVIAASARVVTAGSNYRAGRVRQNLLVVCHVATALILVACSWSLADWVRRLNGVELGFTNESAAILEVTLPIQKYPDAGAADRFLQEVRNQLALTVAGSSFGATNVAPSDQQRTLQGSSVSPSASGRPGFGVGALAATPDYFRAMGIRLIAGREFREADSSGEPVVILSETAARQLALHAESVVGSNLYVRGRAVQVVGIVADVYLQGPNSLASGDAYWPIAQGSLPTSLTLVATNREGPQTALRSLVEAVGKVDAGLPTYNHVTVSALKSKYMRRWQITLALTLFLASAATVTLGIGILALVNNVVTQRLKEFGIRIALGASPARIRWLVVFGMSPLVAAGVALGAVGGVIMFVFAASVIPIPRPSAAGLFGAVCILLMAIVGIAYWAAKRASSVDLTLILRRE